MVDVSRFLWAIVAAGSVVGCEAPEDLGGNVEVRSTKRHGTRWGCRDCGLSNSPIIDTDFVDHIVIDGSATGPGEFSLLALRDPAGLDYPFIFDVHAIYAVKEHLFIGGADLQGWSLIFEVDGVQIPVEIVMYELNLDWTHHQKPIDTYSLAYDLFLGEGQVSVCPGIDVDDTSIVFTVGEGYDKAKYAVIPNQTHLVSMHCRGNNGAKLKFMGYDPNDGNNSTPDERQAALKMLAGDYCGVGEGLTAIGTPLDWTDPLGLTSLPGIPAPANIEAGWNENGAVCLERFRASGFGWDDLKPHCDAPPPCVQGALLPAAIPGALFQSTVP